MAVVRAASKAVGLLATGASVPLGAAGAYLGALSALAATAKDQRSPEVDDIRFVIVVPAHNEELSIAKTVKSLRALDYPEQHFRIVVVADNCSDDTANTALRAGAEVILRNDLTQRGKGYALALAFERLLNAPDLGARPDAVVVVDADTVVSSNLLRAFAGRLRQGEDALQAAYHVENDDATWRTTLMAIAFTCMHDVRSVGRERLRLSAGLRGNGMCFSAHALRTVPHDAASLVEDVEHGLNLAAKGIRVAFVGEAEVRAEMPERAEESVSQRRRWEQGRAKLRRERLVPIVRAALTNSDGVQADLAADLAIPPLAQLGTGLAAGAGVCAAGRLLKGSWPLASLPIGAGLVGLGGHVAVGWQKSGTGIDGLRALGQVPTYVAWKIREAGGLPEPLAAAFGTSFSKTLRNAGGDADKWVRTTRNAETRADSDATENERPNHE